MIPIAPVTKSFTINKDGRKLTIRVVHSWHFFGHFLFHFSVILMIPISFLYFFLSFLSMVTIGLFTVAILEPFSGHFQTHFQVIFEYLAEEQTKGS